MALVLRALCPSCEATGELGVACAERICARQASHFIPADDARAALAMHASQREPLIGQFIGDYLIVQKLGKGGFGKVLLGIQRPLFRLKAAVKLVELAGDGVAHGAQGAKVAKRIAQKFENEAGALATLQHPNIVRLLQYGLFQGRPFMAMELVPGRRTLQSEISRAAAQRTGLTLATVHHLLEQVLNGLEAAHEQEIIHRDIKPANIMLQAVVGDPWHVKLIDFGLAKVLADSAETSLVLGTVSYMAPEQIEGKNLGPWTDLYAVTAVAFELMIGQRVFPGEEAREILRLKLSSSFDPFARPEDGHDLPDSAVEFLRKGLARYPDARFQSTHEMRRAMEAVFSDPQLRAEYSAELSALLDADEVSRPQLGEEQRRPSAPAHDADSPSAVAQPNSPRRSESLPTRALGRVAEGATQGLQTGVAGQRGASAALPKRGVPMSARKRLAVQIAAFTALFGLGAGAVVMLRGDGSSSNGRDARANEATPETATPASIPPQTAPGRDVQEKGSAESRPDLATPAADPLPTTKPEIPSAETAEPANVTTTGMADAVLAIASQPEGATILADGVEIGVTPLTLGTHVGAKHIIALRLAGHVEQSREVAVRSAKESLTTVMQVAPGAAHSAPPARGEARPTARPAAVSRRPPKPPPAEPATRLPFVDDE